MIAHTFSLHTHIEWATEWETKRETLREKDPPPLTLTPPPWGLGTEGGAASTRTWDTRVCCFWWLSRLEGAGRQQQAEGGLGCWRWWANGLYWGSVCLLLLLSSLLLLSFALPLSVSHTLRLSLSLSIPFSLYLSTSLSISRTLPLYFSLYFFLNISKAVERFVLLRNTVLQKGLKIEWNMDYQ